MAACLCGVYQTFGGEELYPDLELKAARLFYTIIKNHPLLNGNKRVASLVLYEFLTRQGIFLQNAEAALARLAVDTAVSDP
jgi:prophage maintenance system killer protein